MAHYTNLSKQNIKDIACLYGFNHLDSWNILHGGSENTNLLLNVEGGKYVLSVCERKTYSEALDLARILDHLERHEFRTSRLIKTKAGESVVLFGEKPIIMREYIGGVVYELMEAKYINHIGVLMAQLHTIPSPDYLPSTFSYAQDIFGEVLSIQGSIPFISWLREKQEYIIYNIHPDLPRSIIHGDIFSDNVVIEDGDVPVIIDFEEACYYYRIFDLGMAAVGLCRADDKIDIDKLEALLLGYCTANTLTVLEKQKLPSFIVYAATATAFWRFRQFNIIHPDDHLSDHYIEMQIIADWAQSNVDLISGLTILKKG